MTRQDTGEVTVREIGLKSDHAQGYERIAQASQDALYARRPDGLSALETFGGPEQEDEIEAQLSRLRQKLEAGVELHPSQRAFLAKHGES